MARDHSGKELALMIGPAGGCAGPPRAPAVGMERARLRDLVSDDGRIGAPRKRKEDPRFLTGASRFTDDIALAGQLHAAVVRFPHAHARIRAVDVAAARSAPGVRLVLTAADVEGEIARPIPSFSRTP